MHSEISPNLGNDRVWEFTDLMDFMIIYGGVRVYTVRFPERSFMVESRYSWT